MLAHVTALYAGLLALLVVILSYRVSRLRLRYRVGTGDGGHEDLMRAVRVQGNAMEYIPFGLLLILLAELNGLPVWSLHVAGSALFLGRLLHALGLGRHTGTSPERFMGTLLTWLTVMALGATLLIRTLL